MAISDLIGKVFSAQFVAGVRQVTPMLSLANDRSGEIRSMGDSLVIPLLNALVSVGDYPTGSTAITYAGLVPTTADLPLDKKKYIAFELEDIDATQMSIDLFAGAIRDSALAFSEQLAADFRAVYVANKAATGVTTLTATLSSTTSPTKSDREAINLLIFELVAGLKTKGFSQRPYVLLHPAVWRQMIEYVSTESNGSFPPLAERAFVDGTLSSVYGADVIVDWQAANPATLDASESYGGIRNRTTVYGGQLSVPEQMRSPSRFARRYRALQTYGMALQDASTMYRLLVT